MTAPNINVLDTCDETSLYRMLGNEFFHQLHPVGGSVHFLPSATEVGKREFEMLLPHIKFALATAGTRDPSTCVTQTIANFGSWRLPSRVVAALAQRRGLIAHEASETYTEPQALAAE